MALPRGTAGKQELIAQKPAPQSMLCHCCQSSCWTQPQTECAPPENPKNPGLFWPEPSKGAESCNSRAAEARIKLAQHSKFSIRRKSYCVQRSNIRGQEENTSPQVALQSQTKDKTHIRFLQSRW